MANDKFECEYGEHLSSNDDEPVRGYDVWSAEDGDWGAPTWLCDVCSATREELGTKLRDHRVPSFRKRPLVHLSLSPDCLARLAEIATRCGETRSGVVERLVRDADLPRYKRPCTPP
jgi:hypothetical protein